MRDTVTMLHLSDLQFGLNHRFGRLRLDPGDEQFDTLLVRLTDDLDLLKRHCGLRPDVLIVSGDLAEWGRRNEFEDVLRFLVGLSEFLELGRERVVLVPGNHDVNRKACESYFSQCEADGCTPQPPYWRKWQDYTRMFSEFYKDRPNIAFTEREPWSLFEIPDLAVVVAGLNSTMRESHRDEDHYGWLGERQLRWFAERLAMRRGQGWLRVGALHHNVGRGAVDDEESLRDVGDLRKYLADRVNVILHGHTHQGRVEWMTPHVPVLSTGSAAVARGARPEEVPNQYEMLRFGPTLLERWGRQYDPSGKRWVGDNTITADGHGWQEAVSVQLLDVSGTFSPPRLAACSGSEGGDSLVTPDTRRMGRCSQGAGDEVAGSAVDGSQAREQVASSTCGHASAGRTEPAAARKGDARSNVGEVPVAVEITSRRAAKRLKDIEGTLDTWYDKLHELERGIAAAADVQIKFSYKSCINDEVLPSIRKLEDEYAGILTRCARVEEIDPRKAADLCQEILGAADALEGDGSSNGSHTLPGLLNDLTERLGDTRGSAAERLKQSLKIIPQIVSEEIGNTGGASTMLFLWESLKELFRGTILSPP